ncbi:hypothetical protein FHR90_000218 [Endobacter medicaginis]|uniref:Uncharacterized protein n=1 Tax=Endobacter medicaginis TaxID=1181271 RepID=A0A850NK68_9PROT|nr:hypothetical protein [Endobacter medicaginis]MBB3172412.1 hypothetical protein [Endobacter medicaginis]MCX5474098.1 hypothetical protein [Endobacter medicaginis]NVN29314.1 hypothetical protein [Endobacter medicaginis]
MHLVRTALFAAGLAGAPTAVAAAEAPTLISHVAPFPAVPGDAAADARIRTAFDHASRNLQSAITACAQQAGTEGGKASWTRTIAVTMSGPTFFSVLAQDDSFCGGAYPDSETSAYVYDLATGSPVNWQRLLPPRFAATGEIVQGLGGSRLGLVHSAFMMSLYRSLYPARLPDIDPANRQDCLDSVEDGFTVWPDASRHALMIQPTAQDHATAACAVPVAVPVATLREIGRTDARLLDALQADH